jgi:type II secretory pathway pseudopilin PulG
MNRKAGKHAGASGFTLLEIVIVAAICAVISISLLAAMPKWQNAYYDNTAFAVNNDRARDVFTRMCDEIRDSGVACPDWNLTSSSITFNQCSGAELTDTLWGPAVTYSYNAQAHTLTRTSEGDSQIVCGNVQSATFTPDGSKIQIMLVVQTHSRQGRAITAQLSGLVFPRN